MGVNPEIENKEEIGNQETECKIHQVNEDLQVENFENQEPFQNSTPYQNLHILKQCSQRSKMLINV